MQQEDIRPSADHRGAEVKIKDCPECVEHAYNAPFLVEACASVGMSQGKTTNQMIGEYMSHYHFNGHPEDHLGTAQEVAGQVLPDSGSADDPADVA